MDAPLTVWYCDVCGEKIANIKEGYVTWKSNSDYRSEGFKVIHQSRCDSRDDPSSAALEDFTGPVGVARLLSYLSVGPIKNHLGQQTRRDVENMDEFVDFFRRMQTPYYEEARRKFGNPDILDYLADANEVYPYLPDHLKSISER